MADHPSPCARQQQLRRLRTRTPGSQCRHHRAALPAPHHAAREGRLVAGHCGRSRSCILCDRCIRGCDDIRHNWCWPAAARDIRPASPSTTICPWATSSCVSCGECMVSCPTGRADQQAGRGERNWEKAIRSRPGRASASPDLQERLRHFPGAQSESAWSSGAIRAGEIICREGEFGSTAFYILEGKVGGLSLQPDRARQDQGQQQRILQQGLKSMLIKPRTETAAARKATGRSSPSMLRLICLTTTPSPNSGRAICSAR